ncbi:hypothetical protein J2741_000263 [Methanolinea mesophila]|nr:hypothetical protein [Methanolinea mesophila]
MNFARVKSPGSRGSGSGSSAMERGNERGRTDDTFFIDCSIFIIMRDRRIPSRTRVRLRAPSLPDPGKKCRIRFHEEMDRIEENARYVPLEEL